MTPPTPVGRVAFVLGFAGLLPQIAAVLVMLFINRGAQTFAGDAPFIAPIVGLTYAGLILSFLGGAWWGFAMQRTAGQGRLAAIAVLPSLTALVLISGGLTGLTRLGLSVDLSCMGTAIVLTLPIDWVLVRQNIAPVNWMTLRVPLSLGLGGLTLVLGMLVTNPEG